MTGEWAPGFPRLPMISRPFRVLAFLLLRRTSCAAVRVARFRLTLSYIEGFFLFAVEVLLIFLLSVGKIFCNEPRFTIFETFTCIIGTFLEFFSKIIIFPCQF